MGAPLGVIMIKVLMISQLRLIDCVTLYTDSVYKLNPYNYLSFKKCLGQFHLLFNYR